MKKFLTKKQIADKHRQEFMSCSDDDIINFAMEVGGNDFKTIPEHVQDVAKKHIAEQPF